MAKSPLAKRLKKAMKKLKEVRWRRQPELLMGDNIPAPMHGVAPRNILGANWWDRERRAAYKRTNYHCKACGVHKSEAKYHSWLEAHEVYRIDYKRGRMFYKEAVPLCHFCHNYIHDGRLQALLGKGEIHHAKYAQIIRHGDKILREAGLQRLPRSEREKLLQISIARGEIAEWHMWRLVLNRKHYPPLWDSAEDQAKEYAGELDE